MIRSYGLWKYIVLEILHLKEKVYVRSFVELKIWYKILILVKKLKL